jgi:hypothetical protein
MASIKEAAVNVESVPPGPALETNLTGSCWNCILSKDSSLRSGPGLLNGSVQHGFYKVTTIITWAWSLVDADVGPALFHVLAPYRVDHGLGLEVQVEQQQR